MTHARHVWPGRILPLHQARHAIAPLCRLFVEEWPSWYGPGCDGNAESDLLACCSPDRIPVAFVALDDRGVPVGTAALRRDSLGSELGLGPWLAGLIVAGPWRRMGVGTALVGAVEAHAQRLGVESIYAATDSATCLLLDRGWIRFPTRIESLRGPLDVLKFRVAGTRNEAP